MERELTIGSLDGPEDALTRIGSVIVGTNNEVFLSQPSERVIRVFDQQGNLLREFAGEGEGPGEFRSMGVIRRLADTLYLTDFETQRTSFFSDEGAFLYSFQFTSPDLGEGLWAPNPTWLLGDGTAMVNPGYFYSAAADGTVSEIPVVRTTRLGEVLNTVVTYSLHTRPFAWDEGSGSYGSESPFSDNPEVDYVPAKGELMIVDAPAPQSGERGAYAVFWLSLDGDTVDTWEISFDPLPIPGHVRDSVIDRAVESVTTGPNPLIQSRRTARTEIERAWDLPDFYPPVTGVQVAEDGRIWVRREDLPGPLVWWDLLSPEGGVEARFHLRSGLEIQESRGSVVWGTERDELGVNYMVRFKILEHGELPGG